MNDDKVDLRSVNKKTKKHEEFLSLAQLKRPFAKKDEYNRDKKGQFTTGSGGVRRITEFNFKRAVPLLLVVALVGGLFVYQSFASSSSDRVIAWYQACRNTTSTSFGGTSYWAGELDAGRATYAKFRDTMRANGDGNCPSSEPAARSTSAPATSTTPAAPASPATQSPSTASQNKVVLWYQACRNTTSTSFGGTSYWAGELDAGRATYAKFRDTMRANGDGNCPDTEPGVAAAKESPTSKAPATTGTMPEKKYHQGRSASPDCFSMPNCVTVVRSLYKTLLARDPGPDSSGVKDYASKMLDWGWTKAQVEQNIKQSAEYSARKSTVEAAIMDYDPSVTDFMDTRSFLWFAYERLCASGTRSAVNYWTKEIDEGRWTRQKFWEHLQSQGCAESVANTRLYDKSGANLTEDGKRAKEIEAELNKVYWEVFLQMWDAGGWKDWDGVHKPGWMWEYDRGNVHLATQMACEEIVWRYRNGIEVGLNDTCFRLVTGQEKPVHSQDIMYGDYFGDKITLEEAIEKIRAVARGEDQSVSCQSAKAQLLPGCDAGAKYVPLEDIKKVAEEKRKESEEQRQAPSNANSRDKSNTEPQKQRDGSAGSSTDSNTNSRRVAGDGNRETDVYSGDIAQNDGFEEYLNYVDAENRFTASIVFPDCVEIDKPIEPSEEGDCVAYVQNAMALIVDPDTKINGIFDKSTEDFLAEFQLSRNVPSSEYGKVGKTTFGLLNKALQPRVLKSPFAPPSGTFVNNR